MKLSITRWQARAIQFVLIPVAASRLLFYPLNISGSSVLIISLFTVAYWQLIKAIDRLVPESVSKVVGINRYNLKQAIAIDLPEGWRLSQDARRDSIMLINDNTGKTIIVRIDNQSVEQVKDAIYNRMAEYYHD